jgi:hypothetical protein
MSSDRACDHAGPLGTEPICEHILLHGEESIGCYRWFVGRGMDSEVLCDDCTQQRQLGQPVTMKRVCDVCLDSFLKDVADLKGVRGSPEVSQQLVPIGNGPRTLPTANHNILDVDPIAGSPHRWVGLDSEGAVVIIDTQDFVIRRVAQVTLVPETGHKPYCCHKLSHRIYASRDGDFVAVVNDYGQWGLVTEVATNRITMKLDGGSYHQETVPFSLCFGLHQGRSVLVHRTAWNRLDVSDPMTGQLLTERSPTGYRWGENRPAHYLDYFHGRVYPSPSGRKILDDGWVWHPVGGPVIWSVERWLGSNVWESEDGPSRHGLCWRDYYWDHGMCWLDDERVAIAGLGDDDILIVPGARIFAIHPEGACQEVAAFPGPSGSFFCDRSRLFSSDESGLSIWDVVNGVQTGHVAGFKPQHMHPISNEFIEICPQQLLIWTLTDAV